MLRALQRLNAPLAKHVLTECRRDLSVSLDLGLVRQTAELQCRSGLVRWSALQGHAPLSTVASVKTEPPSPLHRSMRGPPRLKIDDRPINPASQKYYEGRSVYNGLIQKQVAVSKTRKSDFRFVPIPGKSIDTSRSDFLYYYEGHWVNGLPHGEGTMVFPTGNVFTGDMNEGRCEGFGVETTADGEIVYEGAWVDNKPGGVGKMFMKDGGVYTGQFLNAAREGLGKLVEPDGSTYFGQWAQNRRHGEGILTDGESGKRLSVVFRDGDLAESRPYKAGQGPRLDDTVITVFERDLADGKRPGSLSAKKTDKARVVKESKVDVGKNVREGTAAENLHSNDSHQETASRPPQKYHGVVNTKVAVAKSRRSDFRFKPIPPMLLTQPDYKAEYVYHYRGEWDDNVPHGKGQLHYPSGFVYAGDIADGRCEGWGTECSAEGEMRYEGHWVDNKPNGVGRMRWKNNTIFTGEFSNGSLHGLGRIVEVNGATHYGRWENNDRCELRRKHRRGANAFLTYDSTLSEEDLRRVESFDAELKRSKLPAYPVGAPQLVLHTVAPAAEAPLQAVSAPDARGADRKLGVSGAAAAVRRAPVDAREDSRSHSSRSARDDLETPHTSSARGAAEDEQLSGLSIMLSKNRAVRPASAEAAYTERATIERGARDSGGVSLSSKKTTRSAMTTASEAAGDDSTPLNSYSASKSAEATKRGTVGRKAEHRYETAPTQGDTKAWKKDAASKKAALEYEALPKMPAKGSAPVKVEYTSEIKTSLPLVLQRGTAVLTYADGSTYTGEISGGRRHGLGVTRDAKGVPIHRGKWRFDRVIRTRKVPTDAGDGTTAAGAGAE
jgi:hypothetical protein